MNKLIYFLLITGQLWMHFDAVAQEIKVKELPAWIVDIAHPKTSQVSKYDVQSGAYYTLIDYQSNLNAESTYYHQVQKIVNSGGISQASQLELTYDSAYQEIILHRLTVWRNGQKIDKLNQIQFEYVKNEQELQSSIYSGLVTALAVIEDIRKDDLLEVAYSIRGSNPVYDGMQYQLLPLEDINPIDKVYVRAIYPSDKNYSYNCHGCKTEEVSVREEDRMTELIFERNNLEAVELENTMPPWIIPYNYLEVSNTSTWEEVNLWAQRIFDNHENDQVETVFTEIFNPEMDLEDKVDAAIDFVQDDIRYMGIESGMGSIMPFSPNQTIKQRFGDCKDKSLLLITMLRKIGVSESYVALVNASMQHNVSELIPSGQVFDHCIVYFKYQGREYWIDPTIPFQGGSFKEIATYHYGKALVIKSGTKELFSMDSAKFKGHSVVREAFELTSFESAGILKINSAMTGFKADQTRQILEYYSRKELAEAFKYPYGLLYPLLTETQKLVIRENEEGNIIETEENYSIPNAWTEDGEGYAGQWQFAYEPAGVSNYIYQINCEARSYPVFVDYPARYEQTTLFKLPQAVFTDTLDRKYDNAAFVFEKSTNMPDEKTVEIKYVYQSKIKEISPEAFTQVCYDMNEILNGLRVTFNYPKPGTPSGNSAMSYYKTNSFKFKKDENNFNSYAQWKQNISTGSTGSNNEQLADLFDAVVGSTPAETDVDEVDRVDVQPSYPKGLAKFYKEVSRNIKYPKQAKRMKISGRVYVSFVVRESGTLDSFQVVNGIGAGCDEEAIRVIQTAGKWKPGKKDGKNVDVRMILPVTFKL